MKSYYLYVSLLFFISCEHKGENSVSPNKGEISSNNQEIFRPDITGDPVVISNGTDKITFMRKENAYVIGDMAFTKEQIESFIKRKNLRTGLKGPDQLWWSSGQRRVVIPYVNSTSSDVFNNVIKPAIDHWAQQTAGSFLAPRVLFVPRTSETDYVEFTGGNSGECSSYVGRIGGRQPIVVGGLCQVGNIIHEIGHAVGLFHEHQRTDRDSYIVVNLNNVQTGAENNFYTYAQLGRNGFQFGDLDFDSIMMYGSNYLQKSGSGSTITKIDGSNFNVQRNGLSDGDKATVVNMYKQFMTYQ